MNECPQNLGIRMYDLYWLFTAILVPDRQIIWKTLNILLLSVSKVTVIKLYSYFDQLYVLLG